MKAMIEDEIDKVTQRLASVADATRTCVKDGLRPHVAALMPQAMSTPMSNGRSCPASGPC